MLCPSGQLAYVWHPLELEVPVKGLKLFVIGAWLSCGIAQIPFNEELDSVPGPLMGDNPTS